MPFHPVFKHQVHLVVPSFCHFLFRQGHGNDIIKGTHSIPVRKPIQKRREGPLFLFSAAVFEADDTLPDSPFIAAEGIAAFEMAGVRRIDQPGVPKMFETVFTPEAAGFHDFPAARAGRGVDDIDEILKKSHGCLLFSGKMKSGNNCSSIPQVMYS
jgi:hypothetical protein